MSLQSSLAKTVGLSDPDSSGFQAFFRLSFGLQRLIDSNPERREVLGTVREYTHVNYQRLKFLWDTAEAFAKRRVRGSFVEAGVWRGGCAGILAYLVKKYGYRQRLYFFDSFAGLPLPTTYDGDDANHLVKGARGNGLRSSGTLAADASWISTLLSEQLGIDPRRVAIIRGWFEDTMPAWSKKIDDILILRLDGDWYASTRVTLQNLYDRVVPGGYVIIDDYYFWDGCKIAVDEFIERRRLRVGLRRQDTSGAYFVKP